MQHPLLLRVILLVVVVGLLGALPTTVPAQAKKDKDKSSALTFDVYQKSGKYRFRVLTAQGKSIVLVNKGYPNKADLMEIVTLLQKKAAKANVVEEGKKTADKGKTAVPTFEIYKDKRGRYRFRFYNEKGVRVARSSTGYKTMDEIQQVINTIQQGAAQAKIMERK